MPSPPIPFPHLQAKGGAACPKKLADIAQALALGARLRINLQEEKAKQLKSDRGWAPTAGKRSREATPDLPSWTTLPCSPIHSPASPVLDFT